METTRRESFSPSILQVSLLGVPVVTWAGEVHAIPRRQARALLYYLATDLCPAPREQLCFLLWPEIPDSVARRNLTRLLTALRRALPDPEILRISEERLSLDPDRVWSDTVTLERLRAPQPFQDRLVSLERAVELYRGSFLSGFSLPDSPEFEAWVWQEQRAEERLYLEMLLCLIEAHRQKNNDTAAIAYAQRYLATDELAEGVHRQLIELYASMGNRSAAVRQFEQCVAILERELGVNPLPETQAVYRAVMEGRSSGLSLPTREPVERVLPGADMPHVGRKAALSDLEQAYLQARAGQGKVVVISGEPGIGKTRLLEVFFTCLPSPALILRGAGYPGAQTLPFQPIVEALRFALDLRFSTLRTELQSGAFDLQPCWLAEVSRLLPELRALYPDLPSPLPVESEEARTRLFEALCRFILKLADGPVPLILCLDNLHWADTSTLEWLAYLGERLSGSRLLVTIAFLDEETQSLSELTQALSRSGVLVKIGLTGLDNADVLLLLHHLLSASIDQSELAVRLQRVTGGNPFFFIETVRMLVGAGHLLGNLEETLALPLPGSIREAVQARLARLSAKARQVLEAAAVLGSSFRFDLLCQTAGRGEMETLDSLELLEARHLLVEHRGAYHFQHECIMTTVYSALSYLRRRLLHHRAGLSLEKLYPDDAATLGWHFEQAEDWGKAAHYFLKAGESAKLVFAYLDARTYFNQAMSLLEQESKHLKEPKAIVNNRQLRIQALSQRGWVFRLLGEMDGYVQDLQEEAQLVAETNEPRKLAYLRWREAAAHRWFCRYPQALLTAEQGIRLSQQAGDALLEARCHRELGLAARAAGNFPQAQAALERALQIFVEMGESVYQIHTLGNLATLHGYMGRHEVAMNLAQQALALCDQAGLPFHRRMPLADLGVAATAMGDFRQAQTWLLESLAIARQTGDRTQEIFCLGHLGWLSVKLSQPAEALDHLQAALSLAERLDSRAEQSRLHAGLAEACSLAGNPGEAIAHARRALELAQAHGRAYDEQEARRVLARLEGL